MAYPVPHRRLVLAALLVALGAPSTAAAQTVVESFRVSSVDTVGCNSGNFGMTVLRSDLDGGSYIVRTRVQVGSQLFMNERAGITLNGTSTWNVFDNFTYGIVPNRGVYPIDDSGPMRLDFTLERPKGIVLTSWTLIVDGCDTGNILYNAGPLLIDGFENDGTSPWSSTSP
jgi:hypothetical protein